MSPISEVKISMDHQRETHQRLESLDALRGFDMFWIMGAETFALTLAHVTGWSWARVLGSQMNHVDWAGFRAYDLIFPLFMFISGVAIPFSLLPKVERGEPRRPMFWGLARRAFTLVILGLVVNGGLDLNFHEMRFFSVLGQIGLAYFFAALILMAVKTWRGRLLTVAGILAGVAILQLAIPVPGFGAGVLTPEGCINGYVDRLLMAGHLISGSYDPEGLLCIISAVSLTLMGGLAGLLLRDEGRRPERKALLLAGAGLALVVTGGLLARVYPMIKKAWTSTFDLYAGGWSLLLLALFYYLVDVRKWRRWTFFFRVIGLNSITIYLAMHVVDFNSSSRFLVGGLASRLGSAKPLVLLAGTIALEWMLLYFLNRKRIYLKV